MIIVSELMSRLKPGDTELLVSPEEWTRLVEDEASLHLYDADPMPSPPIKSRSESQSRSFFSWRRSSHVEYDRQDPDYQRQLSAWRLRQEIEKGMKKDLVICGPFGRVVIKVKKDE